MRNGIEIIIIAHSILVSKRKAREIRKEAAVLRHEAEIGRPYLTGGLKGKGIELWKRYDEVYEWVHKNSWMSRKHMLRFLREEFKIAADRTTYISIIDYCLDGPSIEDEEGWREWNEKH